MKNRVKKQALSFAAVMAMILGGGMQLYAADKIADTVYRNGKIYTITETVQEAKDVKNAKKVDVVATLNGKIIFVGSEADAKAQGYLDENKVNKIVDLRGKTMLPGFVDGHGHFPGQGTSDLYKVNLNSPLLDGTVDTMDKLIEELRKKAETLPAGSPIIGWNYDDTQLAEQRHPTRYDLDKASTTHPIYVSHISGHMGAANSLALQKYNVTSATTTEGVEKDASGEPTGVLFETKAMGLVTLSNELETNDNFGIARASQVYAAAGVTTAAVHRHSKFPHSKTLWTPTSSISVSSFIPLATMAMLCLMVPLLTPWERPTVRPWAGRTPVMANSRTPPMQPRLAMTSQAGTSAIRKSLLTCLPIILCSVPTSSSLTALRRDTQRG